LVRGRFMRRKELDGGEEVVHQLFGIYAPLELPALVVVSGIAANGRQAVRGESNEPGLGHAPRNVLDVRVEPPVLVDDDDPADRARRTGGANEIAAYLTMPLRRRIVDVFRMNIGIGKLHLPSERVVRTQ